MNKNKKVFLGVLAVVIVVSAVVLASNGSIFQGKIFNSSKLSEENVFLYKDNMVSAVASSITSASPSVVVSDVTSPGGTSRVASVVVSAVSSAVASAVPLNENDAAKFKAKDLKELTKERLKAIEEEDYKNNQQKYQEAAEKELKENPKKFTLSEGEKQQMIELYKSKYPSEFEFKPAK